MKVTIAFEFEVSDIPEQERKEIIADSGMDDEDMPRIAEMTEKEVRSEIIDTFYSMFNGADYDVQSEMWAGSDFYGYITGIAVRDETLPPSQNVAGGDVYATAPVVLTEWERTRLAQHVASNALTYMGHHARGGLRPAEIEDMERWNALSDKLKAPAAATEADHG